MTKIFEALERVELEQVGRKELPATIPEVRESNRVIAPELANTLINLYRTIFTTIPGPSGRIIQFVESRNGNDCSKLVRAFAKVASSVLKKSVLLLDSDPSEPGDFNFYNHTSRLNWLNELRDDVACNKSHGLGGRDSLFISRLAVDSGLLPVDIDFKQTEEFMHKLKDTFDLTLIDSWSIAEPPRPTLFSPHVDGVVLVIDAGKTRWQIAEKLKCEITAQGGNVLGVILNNRTYPIPQNIYKRL